MGFISKPIFAKLARRFSIRQEGAETLESGKVLVPITDADDLVRLAKASQTTGSATTRTDTYTVPLGKRWRVMSIGGARSNAGSINIQATVAGTTFDLKLQAASTGLFWDNYPMRFDEGDSVIVLFSSGTSGPLTSTVYYLEEDA